MSCLFLAFRNLQSAAMVGAGCKLDDDRHAFNQVERKAGLQNLMTIDKRLIVAIGDIVPTA